MLTNISLANFRGFEEEISVRIRPITVLIGHNSAGKSSLIKFLQMLRQTLESQRDEFFVTDGRYVQLGNWRTLGIRAARQGVFEFSVDIETSDIPAGRVSGNCRNMPVRKTGHRDGRPIRLSLDLVESPVVRISPLAQFNIRGRVRYSKKVQIWTPYCYWDSGWD